MIRALLVTALLLPAPALAQDAALVATARGALAQLQAPSIRQGREYCGVIARAPSGVYRVLPARRGRADSCLPSDRGTRGLAVVASYHTHGAYGAEYDSEVPSLDDVRGDMEEGVHGFVSTPGGRLWHIDPRTGRARQVCGTGCLPADPRFVAGDWGPIARVYSLRALRTRDRAIERDMAVELGMD